MSKRIFACKLSDDFSGFVDTCGTGKRNRAGALVLGNGSIVSRGTRYGIVGKIAGAFSDAWLNLAIFRSGVTGIYICAARDVHSRPIKDQIPSFYYF